MTKEEMSIEFDLLYNNIMSNLAPGLDDYEKSRFLTMAQETIVREYYNGISPLSNSFEKNEAMRRSLADLTTSLEYNINDVFSDIYKHRSHPDIYVNAEKIYYCEDTPYENPDIPKNVAKTKFYDYYIRIPKDVMYIILEYVTYKEQDDLKCFVGAEVALIPATHDEYLRIKDNPFKGPKLRRAIRLDVGRTGRLWMQNDNQEYINSDDLSNQLVEVVSAYMIGTYFMRYVRKPKPIIITDLTVDQHGNSTDVPFDGYTDTMDCELSSIIHRDIVERAVQIAATVYKGNATNNK